MERYFCNGKKDFCGNIEACSECKFADGSGVISEVKVNEMLCSLLGGEISLDRLCELVKADREGRCVVFPCKPSDVTVYQLRNKKHALGPGVHPRHVGCAKVWAGGHYQLEHQGDEPCRDRDFGKKWFLTEDEANAALNDKE